ncbi:MAG: SUF system NifU family Fe-S cluster assembly protein [Bacteroidota bacterium]
MDENLSKLYQGLIAEHNRAPLFFEKRPDAPNMVEAYNPFCGDKFKLYLTIENQVVVSASFHGYGCAVSKAATSVLMKKIQAQPLDRVSEILHQFLTAIAAGEHSDPETAVFAVAKNFPGRAQCATLTHQALADYLLLSSE